MFPRGLPRRRGSGSRWARRNRQTRRIGRRRGAVASRELGCSPGPAESAAAAAAVAAAGSTVRTGAAASGPSSSCGTWWENGGKLTAQPLAKKKNQRVGSTKWGESGRERGQEEELQGEEREQKRHKRVTALLSPKKKLCSPFRLALPFYKKISQVMGEGKKI
ncbi:uncharacterized protein VTP21DRAFT_954 [Calcarisporiella thermophila]|uniref:uncharacterized protein n=1 Tax=Calcarisporiella thermophila TaxID=911321 RepID=UPI003743ACD6